MANLYDVKLKGAYLNGANLEGADLKWANLEGARLLRVDLEGSDVSNLRYNRQTTCRGIRVATCYGSDLFKRFAQDQAWLEEFIETRNTFWKRFWAYLSIQMHPTQSDNKKWANQPELTH